MSVKISLLDFHSFSTSKVVQMSTECDKYTAAQPRPPGGETTKYTVQTAILLREKASALNNYTEPGRQTTARGPNAASSWFVQPGNTAAFVHELSVAACTLQQQR